MRTLELNKQTVYYANPTTPTVIYDSDGFDTGEKTYGYGNPVKLRINVSAAKGNAYTQAFGDKLDYTKVLVADTSLPITEKTVFWIDSLDRTEKHNYTVAGIARSLNSMQIAVKKVDVS
jgi:hypothetical protein